MDDQSVVSGNIEESSEAVMACVDVTIASNVSSSSPVPEYKPPTDWVIILRAGAFRLLVLLLLQLSPLLPILPSSGSSTDEDETAVAASFRRLTNSSTSKLVAIARFLCITFNYSKLLVSSLFSLSLFMYTLLYLLAIYFIGLLNNTTHHVLRSSSLS